MKVDTFSCDNCGQVKGENSHWFRVDFNNTGLQLNPWDAAPATATSIDLCSDSCVTRAVQKWLDMQTATAHHDDRVVRAIVDSVGIR